MPAGQILIHRTPRGQEWEDFTADLAVLASVATCLAPGRLHEGLDEALETLRGALGADAAELFLATSPGGDMILTACTGSHPRDFWERPLFPPGQGFPGLVASTGEDLTTLLLAADPRYLRRGPKRHGYRSYACVPLRDEEAVFGSLHVAWRTSPAPLARALRLLHWVAVPLGTAVCAGRERLHRHLARWRREPRQGLVDSLGAWAGAEAASLLPDPADVGSGPACGDPARCPSRLAGRPVANWGPRSGWPAPCRSLAAACVLCLPFMDGVLQLRYGQPPQPPTRFLADLLEAGASCRAVDTTWALPVEPPGPPPDPPLPGSWEIRCLGPFEIRRAGRPVPLEVFPRRKAVALLKILLLRRGAPLSRDSLCELLWPGAAQAAAANRLHGLVHSLRQVLEPRPWEREWRLLCLEGAGYSLLPSPVLQVDLHRYEALARDARTRQQQGRQDEALALLQEAAALYRGDLFADDPYEEWCWMDREDLRQRHLELLKSLGELLGRRGEHEDGLRCLRLALRIDPLREDLHVACMEYLWHLGRRAEALHQYEECEGRVREELGAEPLPETRRLRQRIVRSLNGSPRQG